MKINRTTNGLLLLIAILLTLLLLKGDVPSKAAASMGAWTCSGMIDPLSFICLPL